MIVDCHFLLRTRPLLPLVHRSRHFSTITRAGTIAESRVQNERAVSGGAVDPESPRATRNQPE